MYRQNSTSFITFHIIFTAQKELKYIKHVKSKQYIKQPKIIATGIL